jgi:phytanoyl-CoA hydroxylase
VSEPDRAGRSGAALEGIALARDPHPMALNEAQLHDFRSQGWVNAGPLFDEAQLETVAKEYDRLVTFDAQVLGNEADGFFPYRAMLNFRSPDLANLILTPALLEIASQVLGDDVRLWWDQGINKAPGAGSEIAWHQDNGYQRGRTQEFLTCWLALDDSTLANGGLEIFGTVKQVLGVHGQALHEAAPGGFGAAL